MCDNEQLRLLYWADTNSNKTLQVLFCFLLKSKIATARTSFGTQTGSDRGFFHVMKFCHFRFPNVLRT